MADFTSNKHQGNTGTLGTPVWTDVPAAGSGTGQEIRYSDLSTQGSTASASWPFITRPASTSGVAYEYIFSADTTSLGLLGTSSSTPAAFANSNYLQHRLNWDNTGTFASAPILTMYASTAHAAITRNDGTILGGSTDTGGTARSYFKIQMYGSGATTQVPAAAPTNAPVVTDGTTGALTPGAGAWLTNYQDAGGDLDYILYGSTPTATTAQVLYYMLACFIGPNLTPGTYTPVVSEKYTWT